MGKTKLTTYMVLRRSETHPGQWQEIDECESSNATSASKKAAATDSVGSAAYVAIPVSTWKNAMLIETVETVEVKVTPLFPLEVAEAK